MALRYLRHFGLPIYDNLSRSLRGAIVEVYHVLSTFRHNSRYPSMREWGRGGASIIPNRKRSRGGNIAVTVQEQ